MRVEVAFVRLDRRHHALDDLYFEAVIAYREVHVVQPGEGLCGCGKMREAVVMGSGVLLGWYHKIRSLRMKMSEEIWKGWRLIIFHCVE